MLKIQGLNTHYGAIHALKGIDLEIHKGEVVSLIGSNGAGKSTLLSTVTGIQKASSGKVMLYDEDITNIAPYQLSKKKISISPEGREVFPDLTVLENLRIGAFSISNKGEIEKNYDRVFTLFPRLKERGISCFKVSIKGKLILVRSLDRSPAMCRWSIPSSFKSWRRAWCSKSPNWLESKWMSLINPILIMVLV